LLLVTAASSLLFAAQPARADEGASLARVNAAVLGTLSTSAPAQRPDAQSRNGDDEAVAALSEFAQSIERPAPTSAKAAKTGSTRDDEIFSALREFAQRLGTDKPSSIKDQPKLAAADNAIDALREFFEKQQQSSPSAPPAAAPAAPAPRAKGPQVEATYVGEKTCLGCHSSHAAEFQKTLMGRIGKNQPGKFACENCHGPGSAHAKAGGGRGVGGIISFRPEDTSRTPEENNAICLNCHERGERTYWKGSTHEMRNLMCTNCHTIMKAVSTKAQLKTAVELDTCFQCHKDRRAQVYRSSHMPMREGKMTCSDCHNPHGSFTEALLRQNSINDTCYKCHAEKRGPFLFEHAPVRENCDLCHEPHGTMNEYLLKVSRPRLCAECHSFGHGLNSGPTAVQTIGRQCQNCHTQVHGTNSPAGALLQR
jgi:DmsE family decaheme c-type cytochrome